MTKRKRKPLPGGKRNPWDKRNEPDELARDAALEAELKALALELADDPRWLAWVHFQYPERLKGKEFPQRVRKLDAAIVALIAARKFDGAMPPARLLCDLGNVADAPRPDRAEVRALMRIDPAIRRRYARTVLGIEPGSAGDSGERRIDRAEAIHRAAVEPGRPGAKPKGEAAQLAQFIERLSSLAAKEPALAKALRAWRTHAAAARAWAACRSPKPATTWRREVQKVRKPSAGKSRRESTE